MEAKALLYSMDITTIQGKRLRFFSLGAIIDSGEEEPLHPVEYTQLMGKTMRQQGSILLMGQNGAGDINSDVNINGQGYVNMEVQAAGVLSLHAHSPLEVNINMPEDTTLSVDGDEVNPERIN